MARGEQQNRYRRQYVPPPEERDGFGWIVLLCAIIFGVVYWGMR